MNRAALDEVELEGWLHELPPAARLLELGPGTGQLAAHAARLGARVHAIDLSARNVAYCQQRGVSAQVGDFRALGHIDGLGLFDGIYAVNALLHVPRAEHASVIAGARHNRARTIRASVRAIHLHKIGLWCSMQF
jgi:2-polyprenyl-3-methyl-5-hydroxy-6-metoxy-1,4-benzoquinol methylase